MMSILTDSDDKMKYRTLVATANIHGNEKLSTDVLKQIVEYVNKSGADLYWEFRHDMRIGEVVDARFADEGVVVSVSLFIPISLVGLFVVPSFAYQEKDVSIENGVKVLNQFSYVSFGAVMVAADSFLPKITAANVLEE